ncbi:restriction endonuclease subunit S [Comamonas aquatica]|uniref:Restriction endonuclease subunit S n=1 Tax=Comamonas aquatica TaxID=225991 RepID=A0AA42L905_9BURK|nr:restriction endonuclease subunit S [Comamonas aquatica]MDH0365116.1 restriction endonuclease subunit S [Comamonas aquatica]
MKPTPLSQLAVVSAGQGAPKDNEFSESGIPFVRAGSLEALLSGKKESELELVSPETAKLRRLKTYPKGTILFAKSGMSATKDRVYVLQNPAHVVSHLATLIPKDGAHVDYLRLALKRFPPSSLIKDPAYPAIGLGEIENFEIPIPEEFDNQIRIAHLLGRVERLIVQRNQHLQQLDDLLKSVFLEMFGDPVRNEKGWTPAPLEQLGSINRGVSKHRPRNDPKLLGGPHPLIQTGEVSNAGTYITTYTQTYSDLGFAQSKLWPAGTLCITIAANIAQTGILTFDACFPDSVVGFLAHEGESNTLYVLGLFWFFQAILEKNAPAAAQKNINLEILRALSVPKPPIELQREFAAIVEKVEGIKSRHQQSLTDLEALYGALSQQAFKGELDLSRVALPAAPLEGEEPVVAVVPTPINTPVIALPETDLLLPALENRAHLLPLLRFWLAAYRGQLDSTPFSVQHFMAAAQNRLAELHPDNDFELGASDYEHIKAWVFEALASGRLAQAFDDAGNRIELKAAQA